MSGNQRVKGGRLPFRHRRWPCFAPSPLQGLGHSATIDYRKERMMKNPWRWIVASLVAVLMDSLFMVSFAPPVSRFLSVFWLLYIAYVSWMSTNEGLKP